VSGRSRDRTFGAVRLVRCAVLVGSLLLTGCEDAPTVPQGPIRAGIYSFQLIPVLDSTDQSTLACQHAYVGIVGSFVFADSLLVHPGNDNQWHATPTTKAGGDADIQFTPASWTVPSAPASTFYVTIFGTLINTGGTGQFNSPSHDVSVYFGMPVGGPREQLTGDTDATGVSGSGLIFGSVFFTIASRHESISCSAGTFRWSLSPA
jgi:hypothetical protein